MKLIEWWKQWRQRVKARRALVAIIKQRDAMLWELMGPKKGQS